MQDYYQLFEISENASEQDIKSAYRRLVKRYHPDKSNEPDASTKFHLIQTAYEILSNSYSRSIYDKVLNEKRLQATIERNQAKYTNHSTTSTKKVKTITFRDYLLSSFRVTPIMSILIIFCIAVLVFHFLVAFLKWRTTEGTYLYQEKIKTRIVQQKVQYYFKGYYGYTVFGNNYIAWKEFCSNDYEELSKKVIDSEVVTYYNLFNPKEYDFAYEDFSPRSVSNMMMFFMIPIIIILFGVKSMVYRWKTGHSMWS